MKKNPLLYIHFVIEKYSSSDIGLFYEFFGANCPEIQFILGPEPPAFFDIDTQMQGLN